MALKRWQADMKDSNHSRRWRESKIYYKIGSYFKGCQNCGEKEIIKLGERSVVRYLSGYQVMRSYKPWVVGWTYWCYECGAKDAKCWKAEDYGLEPTRSIGEEMAEHIASNKTNALREFHEKLKEDAAYKAKVEARKNDASYAATEAFVQKVKVAIDEADELRRLKKRLAEIEAAILKRQ